MNKNSREILSNGLTKLLSPAKLNGITLPNRVIKAATFEGMLDDNHNITDQCIEFHENMAKGGVGMTTLAYCAPEPDGRMIDSYLYIREEIKPQLQKLAEKVHQQGVFLSGQIAHCGGFSRNKKLQRKRPVAPSTQFLMTGLPYGIYFSQKMDRKRMDEVTDSFVQTAKIMKESGFDALEIHFGHGSLLSQFISPLTNKRKDEYGGSIENRMRYPLEVLHAIRQEVGSNFPILAKISLFDDVKGGISLEDGIKSAELLDKAGIDGIILSAGTSSQNPMLLFHGDSILPGLLTYEKSPLLRLGMKMISKRFFRNYPYKELYLFEAAKKVREVVHCNLIYIGGAMTPESLAIVMDAGFDFVQSGRPLIRDSQLVHHLKEYGMNYVNGCDACNQCAPMMSDPNGIRCVKEKWEAPHSSTAS
ncbi:MAG TPA: NADH:flavin oxidoreductase [Brumimicrobium sp.]|nr:NADH:flavin oxidoreductase [Brumimicrobium sp.]